MANMWYYSNKNKQKGPVTWDDLTGLAQTGQLQSSDMVWEEGTPDWIKASQVRGLFRGRGETSPGRDDEPSSRRRGPDDDLGDRRRRDPDDDLGIRRRRSRREESSSKGLLIGLIIGGVSLLVVAVVVIIIVVSGNRSGGKGGGGGGPGGGVETFTFDNMFQDDIQTRDVFLKAGRNVEVRVDTTVIGGGFADVDLFIEEPGGREIAFDDRGDKDCVVRFVVPRDGNYRIVVDNLGPGRVSCRVTVR
jgi:hypothetical protein